VVIYFITDVDNFRTLEFVKDFITEVKILRMAEGKMGISNNPYVFGFGHIACFG
jgi:hypothetical protein